MRFFFVMRLDERLGLARLAYLRAVADARARSTRTSWQRLLSASRNVSDAIREQERERSRREARARGGHTAAAPVVLGGRRRAPPVCEPAQRQELEREWERSRSLIAWSKRLARESRALCSRAPS